MTQIFPAWRDENAKSQYPFADSGASTATQDGRVLPREAILDAAVYGPNITLPVHLSSIQVLANKQGVIFTLSDASNQSIGSGTWPPAPGVSPDVVNFARTDGVLTATFTVSPIGLQGIMLWPVGTYLFGQSAAPIVLGCCFNFGEPSAARLVDGVMLPEQGDVNLVAENGLQFDSQAVIEIIDGVATQVSRVYVHAVGDPLSARNQCATTFVEPRFITEVVFQKGSKTHTCKPSGLGEITILAGGFSGDSSALRIYQTESGILIGLFGKQLQTVR